MEADELVWNEPPLKRWFGGITKDKTKACYKTAMRQYMQYTKISSVQLIDEALEDQKRDPREKTDIVKQRLLGFFKWLSEQKSKKAPGGLETNRKGLSSKTCHVSVNAVRSFYGTYEIYVKLSGRSRLPKARVTNPRTILSNLEVKKLVDHGRRPRDRAIILTMFQSGIDVSTLCSMKYKDVSKGLAKNEHPLKLDLYRGKAGVTFFTFLGRDAIESIKVYLDDLKSKGITLSPDTPLFLKEGIKALSAEGITTDLVQIMLKDIALKSGLIDEAMNGNTINPISPHALRESFGSILANHGVPDNVIDFFLGHTISEQDQAYKKLNTDDLKRLYLEMEPHFSISVKTIDQHEIDAKINEKVDERIRVLQRLIDRYANENTDLKDRIGKTEKGLSELREILQQLLEKEENESHE